MTKIFSYESVSTSLCTVRMVLGLCLLLAFTASPLIAQTVDPKTGAVIASEPTEPEKGGLGGAWKVRKNARTTTQSIPAPRGQITDRNGQPFAQNKVVWYPAIRFGQFEKADKQAVIAWGRKRVEFINQMFSISWTIKDEELWEHYRHRRWFALPVTHVVHAERKSELESKLLTGVIFHPVYMRYYPQGECASHIIGYVGSAGKLEKGPINYGDPIFERTEGRAGLEKIFDKVLVGKEGLLREDYEGDGTQVLKKYERRPSPGGTIVTTLDMDWQKHAEKVLKRHCERGAFVVIDIHTGEVLAMASRPGFDLNDFIPFISTEKYDALRDDPAKPLFARAFQGAYPPASAFKPIVALTALSNGEIYEDSLIDCPGKIKIGNHWFHNWSKSSEGRMTVKRALARSNNPWFYQVGIRTGPTAFLSVARRLGMGSKTGLPLIGETPGLIPSNAWMKKHHGRKLTDGDTANLAIGQGVMLASPLQVAQAMAGVANGGALPKLHLVKQQQNVGGKVMVANNPERRTWLNLSPDAVPIVHEGMMDVVHAGYGTGKRGKLSFTILCGKTGTAQWGPQSKEQRLAWFAGFFPLENPRYAFAALYEGKPHEKLSGGRKAAPMVSSFFEHFKKEIKKSITPPPRAMVIDEDGEGEDEEGRILGDGEAPRAIPVEDEDDGLVPGGDEPRPLRAIPVEEDEDEEDDEEPLPPLRPLRKFNTDSDR
ncbi:MAG: penicillin-binding transpeptidase domain-containing protein [Akkermansiaceae bacterium]